MSLLLLLLPDLVHVAEPVVKVECRHPTLGALRVVDPLAEDLLPGLKREAGEKIKKGFIVCFITNFQQNKRTFKLLIYSSSQVIIKWR